MLIYKWVILNFSNVNTLQTNTNRNFLKFIILYMYLFQDLLNQINLKYF